LFQQFVVDAYTCIKEIRLMWVRRNQSALRTELHSRLRDVVIRGDTAPASIGKRIVLPSSFLGSPRYMIDYLDAIASCRWESNHDLFITFTYNEKWLKIEIFLSMHPSQKLNDRPNIVGKPILWNNTCW
jgi:hypothetical protein